MKVTIPNDANRDGIDEGITLDVTDTGARLLRSLAAGAMHPGPSQGQAAAKLVRDGLARRVGRWADDVELTALGRSALAAITGNAPPGTTYRFAFTRIGRTHNPPGFDYGDDGPRDDRLAERMADAVYRHARAYLASRGIEAHVDLDADTGAGKVHIFAGFHNAGEGTIELITQAATTP